MPRLRHPAIALLVLLALWPTLALGQAPRAGVVTNLKGSATAARVALPQPVALKFKDDVFLQDRIETAEQSLARLLLGGKAVVTIRERSVLTVTEIPDRATLNLQSGKIALAVAREKMRPGEVIEIRTPSAVAAVRGTVVAVDSGGDIWVISDPSGRGALVTPLNPVTGAPIGPPINLGDLQKYVRATGGVDRIPPDEVAKIVSEFQVDPPHTQAANEDALIAYHMGEAVALLGSLPHLFVTPVPPLPELVVIPQIRITEVGDQTQTGTGETAQSSEGETGSAGGDGPKLFENGGFETGDLTGWTLSGAGTVISQFGGETIFPAEGEFMFFGHTGNGAVLTSPCTPATPCQQSVLSQTFTATKPLLLVEFKYVLLTNEVNCSDGCQFRNTATDPVTGKTDDSLNDAWQVRLVSSSGAITVFETNAEKEAGNFIQSEAVSIDTNGDGKADFRLASDAAQSNGFQTFSRSVVVDPGDVTIEFSVSDIGDTNYDSGALLDAVVAAADPPLYFLRDGSAFVRTDPTPLLRLIDTSLTFDSLMVVCCNSSATLAGPLLRATNSNLTVPFSLVSVIQDGTLTTSSAEPLVLLEGGTHSLGSAVGVFDIAGTRWAVDPASGLTLGTDRPLQHSGPFLEASGASITTRRVLKLDTALLEASRPLINLMARSNLTTEAAAIDLGYRSKVTSLGSLVTLNASTLTARGALINVHGSVLAGSGTLLSLANGSTLNALALASVSGGGQFNWAGPLGVFSGTGNAINFNNSLCASNSCVSAAGGLKFALQGGALASNVVATNPAPWVGLGTNGTVNLPSNGAHFLVSGAASKVTITE